MLLFGVTDITVVVGSVGDTGRERVVFIFVLRVVDTGIF